MVHRVEKLPDEPIIIRTIDDDIQTEEEQRSAMLADITLIEQQPEPVVLILDVTHAAILSSLDNLMVAANMTTRQIGIFKHPKVRQVVIVCTMNRLIELLAKGMDSAVYGFQKIKLVRTIDEALACARDSISPGIAQR